MAARQTLTLFVRVQILLPQYQKSTASAVLFCFVWWKDSQNPRRFSRKRGFASLCLLLRSKNEPHYVRSEKNFKKWDE